MSVTSQLKDPNSPLSTFFASKRKATLTPIIDGVNALLKESECIIYSTDIDYLMSGGMFGMAFRWWFAPNTDHAWIARMGAEKLHAQAFFDAVIEFGDRDYAKIPFMSYYLYLFEQMRRTGTAPRSIRAARGLYEAKLPLLGPSAFSEQQSNTIHDVDLLFKTIPSVWETLRVQSGDYIPSPTFEGSQDVGGADAFMIYNGVVWDVKCTKKSAPMTEDLLLQQIAYVLLDYEDEYELHSIGWYFARQRRTIVLKISSLIRDVKALRKELREWLHKDAQKRLPPSRSPYPAVDDDDDDFDERDYYASRYLDLPDDFDDFEFMD